MVLMAMASSQAIRPKMFHLSKIKEYSLVKEKLL